MTGPTLCVHFCCLIWYLFQPCCSAQHLQSAWLCAQKPLHPLGPCSCHQDSPQAVLETSSQLAQPKTLACEHSKHHTAHFVVESILLCLVTAALAKVAVQLSVKVAGQHLPNVIPIQPVIACPLEEQDLPRTSLAHHELNSGSMVE